MRKVSCERTTDATGAASRSGKGIGSVGIFLSWSERKLTPFRQREVENMAFVPATNPDDLPFIQKRAYGDGKPKAEVLRLYSDSVHD